MILKHPLSPEEKKTSQINYNLFSAVNGASYMCLGETVIILFAVKLHAQNILIAVIGAMMYLGFLLLPLGVIRTGQVGAARSQADFWVCRNIAALLVAASAFLVLVYPTLAMAVLLLGSFLFYGFRAAGVVMSQPLIGDITTESDRARIIAQSTGLFYLTGVLAMITISLLLNFFDHIYMLVGIIVTGALLGITASGFIRKIDETADLQRSARKPLLPQLLDALLDQTLTRQIYAGFMVNLSIIMLAPISILAIKRGYGVSDTRAILFSILQFASAIAATQIGGKVTERIGPRKVAIYAYFTNLLVCIFWMLAPASAQTVGWWWILFLLPFIIVGMTTVSMQNAMIHYFLMSVPKPKQVASSMFINVATGAAAGVTGMLLAGFLLKFAERFAGPEAPPENTFRIYFAAAGVIFLLGGWLVIRLVPVIDTFLKDNGMEQTRSLIREVVKHPR